MIYLNSPLITGLEKEYLNQLFINKKFSGKGSFTHKSQDLLLNILRIPNRKALLTTSCTDALEMAAILANIKPGDEVIMPSFTFVSSANAFVLRGAKIVFVDTEPTSMNIDPACIRNAITTKTKAVLVVHYGGTSCDMGLVKQICQENKVILIEDAAQALTSSFEDQMLGTWGDLACFSFHDTKNFHCGEGGALIVNDKSLIERAEIILEKGTDRNKFMNGLLDKYTWQDIGSSFLLSELNASFLLAQLEAVAKVSIRRLEIWEKYNQGTEKLVAQNKMYALKPNSSCQGNAHLFAIILNTRKARVEFTEYMKQQEIQVLPHYIPLHSSPAGIKYGTFVGEDRFTTNLSERLVRLPLYYELNEDQISKILISIQGFEAW